MFLHFKKHFRPYLFDCFILTRKMTDFWPETYQLKLSLRIDRKSNQNCINFFCYKNIVKLPQVQNSGLKIIRQNAEDKQFVYFEGNGVAILLFIYSGVFSQQSKNVKKVTRRM